MPNDIFFDDSTAAERAAERIEMMLRSYRRDTERLLARIRVIVSEAGKQNIVAAMGQQKAQQMQTAYDAIEAMAANQFGTQETSL